LNTASANCFSPATPERALARRRARHANPPHARCARTPMHRRTHRSMRRARELLCATSVVAWTVPGGCFPLAGVPTAARHWAAGPPTSPRLAAQAARAPATWLPSGPPNQPPASINTRPGCSFARANRHLSSAISPLTPPVQTSLPLTPSPPQAPELFLVHH
jgi:hypothetical protein